ncbi:hypothetical protein SAMN05216548_11469 [Faunimonas pinastri]|uniref:Uncharacterized protein n=1 Tax=Faunimonas pinastri TaxID=1855383 RepID=A0A1H9MX89_9HYPH|nr:hypothetical protein [Faunimonas pinastri]SER27713.1 hypothetical protein SAMN05216548_11469 [Faunimonas pinastri]
MILRVDIWGGERHIKLLKRQHYDLHDQSWIEESKLDLAAGLLVNTRVLESHELDRASDNFDHRHHQRTH